MYGPFGAVERAELIGCEIESDKQQTSLRQASFRRTFSGQHGSSEFFLASIFALIGAFFWMNERVEAQLRAWRWGRQIHTFSLLGFIAVGPLLTGDALADQPSVRFDVPALAEAVVKDQEISFGREELMTIEVSVPVTSEIAAADRNHVNEFRYDLQWQQARYPVLDYGPRTQTTSKVEGTIGVDTQKDRSATFGITINGGDVDWLGGSAKAEAAKRDVAKLHYQEIPQHDVLVASGSMNRGTGVFFRFHRSRRETLEGSRDLSVSFRVPSDWQAGLLQVKCRASGERKVAGLWSEPIEIVRSFTLPVYLASSSDAHDRAIEYVRAENSLQMVSLAAKTQATQSKAPTSFERTLRGILGAPVSEPQSRVVRYRVPYSASDATGRYRNAREQLLQLSR